jgi:cell division transport system ATP-binding protein
MITLTNVSVAYNEHDILTDVSLQVKPGEFVFIIGQTGSGKSTLLKLLYMDLLPTKGTVAIGKHYSSTITPREKATLRRSLGIVFQDYRLLDDRSIYENVAFPLEVTGVRRRDIKRKALRALTDVGLSHQRHRKPQELSGGEQQRAVLARAMVNSPDFLLADEPTGNLDPASAKDIFQLLQTFNTRGTGVIMATHNYDLVHTSEGRLVKIEDGRVTEIARAT